MKIYLVEDTGNTPGRILAVFRNEEDAIDFAEKIGDAGVMERTVQEGQISAGRYLP